MFTFDKTLNMNATIDLLKGLHPGHYLENELKKRKISKKVFAENVHEHLQTIVSITKAKRKFTTALSLKTEDFLHLEEGFILTLQAFYEIKKTKNLFLQPSTEIKEFNAGMHHIDIQKIDGKYYYVYDGNRLIDQEKHLNIRGTLKLNYLDIKNLFF